MILSYQYSFIPPVLDTVLDIVHDLAKNHSQAQKSLSWIWGRMEELQKGNKGFEKEVHVC